jgi:group I intron endonuclease
MIVYLITNTANGKRYVGITTHSISKRWPEHCFLARTHAKQALYRAIRKHGISCFSIREIDTADTLDELKKKERHYIEYFGTYTKTGHGYNMTLGGDGVFGFEFSNETKIAMAQAGAARFSDPAERERQRLRQQAFWTERKRAEHAEKITYAHRRNPELARRHSDFMNQNTNPEVMRRRSRQFWDSPGAKQNFKRQKANYWSDPANREKRSREISQRFANNPEYARHVSEGKKRQYRDNPEAGRRHSEKMKARYAQNPDLLKALSERGYRSYQQDPTLAARQGTSRRRFYEHNPDARVRAAAVAREKAARRRALRRELELLAQDFRLRTGESFAIPSRSEGGWKETKMTALIARVKALLSERNRT